ncbi:MAG: hypothetical protein AUF65_02270 [Chloroflexi bacterium 13_1_20CM_50_12]|nr:MAG: hypothetical protein AUF65_02270 [Chloroflexi bacterium 13_1_20CM_50_12]
MTKTATLPRTVEFKTFHFELKSVDEDRGIVTGYLSTFDNVDEQNDRVSRGAFKKTIQEAKTRKAGGRRFLYPMLWMHDPNEPIGGVDDAVEDEHGLLITARLDISTNAQGIPNNQKATMVFSGFKSGYVDELSMGYHPIQKAYENGVRNLKECRLIESSAVTMLFAANPEALVSSSGVKNITGDIKDIETMDIDIANMEIKGVCGNTSGPIGPRDESWDGAKAKGQIFAAAEKDDGTLDVAVCKKYFMSLSGDPQQKGSWGLPFWYVGDNPHICVGAVKAIAGWLGGARG